MKSENGEPAESEPLEYFKLGRKIQQGITACTRSVAGKEPGDVFYLWLQLGPAEDADSVSRDQWLGIIDEAASIGVNWLVVTLGDTATSRECVGPVLRWAAETYEMTICLHAPEGELRASERELLRQLPRKTSYLLVEPEHASSFDDLRADGVNVRLASPASPSGERCEYPYKMIYVNASGKLYTCGLVSGEQDFFLGSAFEGGLDQIMHNPRLPHVITVTQPSSQHKNCSGCPPLVAKYLCHK